MIEIELLVDDEKKSDIAIGVAEYAIAGAKSVIEAASSQKDRESFRIKEIEK